MAIERLYMIQPVFKSSRCVDNILLQTNSYGRTALHYAAMEGNLHVCTLLLASGASADARDNTLAPDPQVVI